MCGEPGLTLGEAGYVTGQSTAALNRVIDRSGVRVRSRRRGGVELRVVGPAEVRFLAVNEAVARDLTPAARRKLYAAIRRLPADASILDLGLMAFRLSDVDRRIAERLARLDEIKAMIEERPGAGPVMRGTGLSPYAVAALVRDKGTAAARAKHAALTDAIVAAASDYAAIYPKPGRPPVEPFKQALSDLAASGAWDIDTEAIGAPRPIP